MAEVEGQPLLQVPRHEFKVVDDGTRETVEITVQLPGVASASEISVSIEPPQTVTVTVPNRYHLQLRLAVPIAKRAERVSFRTKSSKLNMWCRVLTPAEIAEAQAEAAAEAAAAAGTCGGNSSSSGETSQQAIAASPLHSVGSSRDGSNAGAGAAAAASSPVAAAGSSSGAGSSGGRQQQQQQQQRDPASVLESFLPPPTKAERKRMQQEEHRRKEEEERRRREQEAAAAAEAERQRQLEAAAAARRAAEEKRREEARRKAAAKAAAAEEAQRKEQQRRLNKAAAEEWLSRGHSAVAAGDIDVASKALSKVKELDPSNKDGIQKLTKELSALRQRAAAAAAAANRSSSGSSPGASSAAAGSSNGTEPPAAGSDGRQQQQPQQPQQQQRKQSWGERRQAHRHGVMDREVQDILDKWSAGGHARNIVGCWCDLVDFLCYWVTWLAAVTVEWANGVPASRLCSGRAGSALVWCVRTAGNVVMLAPPLSMIVWQLAWRKPLEVVAYVRRVGGDSHLEATEWLLDWQAWLADVESVPSAFTKLVLAGSTGGTAYAAVYSTCWMPLGSHSLLGWLWALLGWVWRILLWDTSYMLQVAAAGIGTGFCSVARSGPCWLTLYPLQVLLSGRRWQTVLTLLGSFVYSTLVNDWRPSWKQHRAPWWQAVLVITVPTLIARSISRLGIGWLFSWPLVLVAYAAQGVLKVVGLPVQFVGHIVTAMFEGPAAALWPWVSAAVGFISWPLRTALRLGLAAVRFMALTALPEAWLAGITDTLCSPESQKVVGSLCGALTAGARAKAESVNLAAFPHAWYWDAGLFVWLFYVTAVITQWEEEHGQEYYRRRQQYEQQRRSQRQQQRRQQRAGSDDEAEHDSLGDKQTDFPMGFGAVAVPAGCEVASVKAVLEATDYYKVMGYSSRDEVTAESLKTKRRQLVLAVHPDKVGHDHPGANQAAGRVNKAYETLSDPAKRSAYDSILTNHARGRAGRSAAAGGSGSGYVEEYSDELYERPPAEDKFMCQDMGCPGCGGYHTAYILPKAPFGVRWCGECKDWHPVGKGEVWAHWTPGPMGMSWLGGARLLLCADPDGPTYDVTEVFRCKEAAGILPKHKGMCNTHVNPFMEATRGYGGGGGERGGGGSSTARRSRKKGRRR